MRQRAISSKLKYTTTNLCEDEVTGGIDGRILQEDLSERNERELRELMENRCAHPQAKVRCSQPSQT